MNRYGIPKEDSKELKNNIDNSSSGGGKMEYYKTNKEKYEFEEGSPLLTLYHTILHYPSIIRYNDRSMVKFCAPIGVGLVIESTMSEIMNACEAIAFDPNIKTSMYCPELADYNCNNLQELIKYLETVKGLPWKDDVLIPITEEEFYNLD